VLSVLVRAAQSLACARQLGLEVGKVGAIKRARGFIDAAGQLALIDQVGEVPVEVADRLVGLGVFAVQARRRSRRRERRQAIELRTVAVGAPVAERMVSRSS
jgi:hypothetical protein